MRKLVLATKNKGKIRELQELLTGLPLEVTGMENYPDAPNPEETGTTFAANAFIKAKEIGDFCGELTLADDSGLEVDALGGEPGVYSARYGQAGWNDVQRYRHLLANMEGVSDEKRSARFRAVVVIYDPQTGLTIEADGAVEGRIDREPRGEHGFGYDPVFYIPDKRCTMAELDEETKNQLSHRARAIGKIIPKLEEFLKDT